MKVLAFAATTSSQSINKQLAAYAGQLLKSEIDGRAEIEMIDLNDFEMPIYSADREAESGIPEQAHAFRNKIGEADAVIISFAEHNGSYTAAYKNTFDWTSRIDMKVYQDKPVILLATSPGPGGAQSVLGSAVGSAPYFGMDVKGSLSVPAFYDNFDAAAQSLKDAELKDQLRSILTNLK
ncbi:NADPH-dependent FMN reductase [Endozoicomonadaceae bacterium StTr2]